MKVSMSKHNNDAKFIPNSTPFVGKILRFARKTSTATQSSRKLSPIIRILKVSQAKGISLTVSEYISSPKDAVDNGIMFRQVQYSDDE